MSSEVVPGPQKAGRLLIWVGLVVMVLWAIAFALTLIMLTAQHSLVLALWQVWLCGGAAIALFGWFILALDKRRR